MIHPPPLTLESQLLIKSSALPADEKILWVHAPKDALLRHWTSPQHHYSWQLDHHENALNYLAHTDCELGVCPTPIADLAHIVLFASKSKQWFGALASQLLWTANDTTLWLIGAKSHGTASLAKRLDHIFAAQNAGLTMKKVASGKHCQLYSGRVIKPHDFLPPSPTLTPSFRYEIEINHTRLQVYSLPGVFSATHVDEGTELLIKQLPHWSQGKRILDFGCGTGVIGGWILKSNPAHEVTFLDIDARAVASTEVTLRANQLDATIDLANCIPSDVASFDVIVSNPPFHDGFDKDLSATQRFIADAAHSLQPDTGELWLVSNRFLPYEATLKGQFETVKKIAASNKFTVWRAMHRRI